MTDSQNAVSPCGLYCAECPFHVGKIADLARDLRAELRKNRTEKTAELLATIPYFKGFENYQTCYETLGLFVKMRCGKVCRDGGGNPRCAIKLCAEKKGYEGCWECNDFVTCSKLDFLKVGHGDAHIKNMRKIKRKGIKEFLEGEKPWYSKPKE